MNRNRLNPYTATPSAPKSHRARVRFLTTPELLTFKCHHARCRKVGPLAAKWVTKFWRQFSRLCMGGRARSSRAARHYRRRIAEKESFGHVHGRRLRGEFRLIFTFPHTRAYLFR